MLHLPEQDSCWNGRVTIAEIPLTQGKIAIVDDEDYDRVSQFKWHAMKQRRGFVAARKPKNETIYMHRFILGIGKEIEIVDHKNGNGLDNRRCNLRPATYKQNSANRKRTVGNMYSDYKGVRPAGYGGKWTAYFKHQYLGSFKTQEQAAMAYDIAARIIYGEFANTNF